MIALLTAAFLGLDELVGDTRDALVLDRLLTLSATALRTRESTRRGAPAAGSNPTGASPTIRPAA
jgi:hypothetical protein